jgi:hypothetical protein
MSHFLPVEKKRKDLQQDKKTSELKTVGLSVKMLR